MFRDRELWGKLMERAMARRFSWAAAAQRYEQLYRDLADQSEEAAA
jgi:glycogen synthase